MDPKVILLTVWFVWFAATAVWAQDSQLISEANDVSHTQVISNKPIVIHTQLDNYEQPTLREYQECHDNAEKCRAVCQGVVNIEACEKQCPICPELIKEEKVVQGVNDTLVAPQSNPVNMTNIIRLTNQIENIIDNSRGNITYRNENMFNVHQNSSRVGGKFGMGHRDGDPCCIVVRPKKQCDTQRFSTAARCHRKRHRVCGPQCKSRIMLAKVVTECEQPDPLEYFEENEDRNCHQTVQYVPYHQGRPSHHISQNKCNYIPIWPYVACPQNQYHQQAGVPQSCSRCMRLPYAYILRNGMPLQCQPCFRSFNPPPNYGYAPPYAPAMWYPPLAPPMFDYPPYPVVDNDFDFDTSGSEWKPDKVKCISPEGTITDDCIEGSGGAVDVPHVTSSPAIVDDNIEDYDYDPSEDPFIRRRRQTFIRSKYSRRNKRQ